MRIAVTTPTGHVGRHLVPILVRAGVRPLVLARRPEKLPARLRAEVDTVAVDQFDSDAVVEATAGVDTIYWVDPPPSGDDPLAEYRRAATSIARAVTKNGIGRVVFQSSVGAEKRRGAGEGAYSRSLLPALPLDAHEETDRASDRNVQKSDDVRDQGTDDKHCWLSGVGLYTKKPGPVGPGFTKKATRNWLRRSRRRPAGRAGCGRHRAARHRGESDS